MLEKKRIHEYIHVSLDCLPPVMEPFIQIMIVPQFSYQSFFSAFMCVYAYTGMPCFIVLFSVALCMYCFLQVEDLWQSCFE